MKTDLKKIGHEDWICVKLNYEHVQRRALLLGLASLKPQLLIPQCYYINNNLFYNLSDIDTLQRRTENIT
jgi:hypothetical protein